MAYHFRRLKQSLRLIPSTKSIGFSTRVSESDQTKHPPAERGCCQLAGTEQVVKSLICVTDPLVTTCSSPPALSTVLRSASDAELVNQLNQLQPTQQTSHMNHPMSYSDIVQILLPGNRANDGSSSCDDISSVLSCIRSVHLTSDDIYVGTRHSVHGHTLYDTWSDQVTDHVTDSHFYGREKDFIYPILTCDPWSAERLVDTYAAPLSSHGVSVTQTPSCLMYSNHSGAPGSPGSDHSKDGPTAEQMHNARDKVENLVYNLFKGSHNYELLHKNVVMENNLFGDNKIAVGLSGYRLELYKLRLRIHAMLFSTSMEILSVTMLEQSGVIRIHWRLKGLPQIQNLKFWRLFQSRETIAKEDWEWLEAFSYFHIGKDGLVHKHRIDRMMPDNEAEVDLTEKLRGLLNPAKPLVS